MKKKRRLLITLLLICCLGMSACSSGESTKPSPDPEALHTGNEVENTSPQPNGDTHQQVQTSREEKIEQLKAMVPQGISKIPETAKEFAEFPPGIFSGKDFNENKEEVKQQLRQFPDIEDPDEEIINLYYLALLGLIGEDYPDPTEVIDQIKYASYGNPEIEDPRFAVKENYNVQIILDASGSMAEMADGKSRMEAAKEAIMAFAESLPKEANVALRVYGHKGSGKASDKALSCGSSELVYGMEPYDASKMQAALSKFQPAGYTPIAYSLEEAMKDFSILPGENNTNIVYLVSDGIETCDGDPVEAARELASSDITPIVNVIGFATDEQGQQQLQAVAQAAGGRFVLIQNQEELQKEFDQTAEMADKWWKWKFEAENDAFSNLLKLDKSILRFSLDWAAKSNREDNRIYNLISQLEYDQIVSEEITDELDRLRQKRWKLANQHEHELEAMLNSLSDKTYKEAVDTINNLYDQNVKK